MRIVDTAINNLGKEIPLHDLKNDYLTYIPPRSRWNFERIRNNILGLIVNPGNETIFKTFLIAEFNKIIKASPDELGAYVLHTQIHFPNLLFNTITDSQTAFGKKVEKAFEYSTFRKTTKAKWFARALNIKTCLYCNSQFTLIISKKSSSGLLFQFDHFISKSKHPYLSLSMCNLIPSCSNCNIAKSKIDFNLTNSVHPYKEDINKYLKFNVSNPDVLDYLINKKGSDISIILKHKNLKVQKHIDTFSLEKIFNEHTDFVEEIFLKAYYYDKSTQKELTEVFNGLIDKNMIKRFILGNYYLDSDLNKRPLSKMVKDIAMQVKLID